MAVHKKTLLVSLLAVVFTAVNPQIVLSTEILAQANPETQPNLNELLRKGRELVDSGQIAQAIALYQQAARLDGKNPRIYSGIGYLEARQGNFQAAAESYQ